MQSLETPAVDPLPPYSPPASQSRDAETASIRSTAPSYNSEPPAYEYVVSRTSAPNANASPTQPNGQLDAPQQGLPRMHYAPGFIPRPANPFCSSNYSLVSWSTVQRNPRRRQYENVARRRVEQGQLMDSLVVTLAQVVTPPSPPSLLDGHGHWQDSGEAREGESATARTGQESNIAVRATSLLDITTPLIQSSASSPAAITTAINNQPPETSNAPPTSPPTVHRASHPAQSSAAAVQAPAPQSPPPTTISPSIHPHEDPALVGPVAAERARSQRLYREMMLRDPARVMAQESLGWDFMLAQSADWEERQRKWRQYRQWGWKGRLAHLGAKRIG